MANRICPLCGVESKGRKLEDLLYNVMRVAQDRGIVAGLKQATSFSLAMIAVVIETASWMLWHNSLPEDDK